MSARAHRTMVMGRRSLGGYGANSSGKTLITPKWTQTNGPRLTDLRNLLTNNYLHITLAQNARHHKNYYYSHFFVYFTDTIISVELAIVRSQKGPKLNPSKYNIALKRLVNQVKKLNISSSVFVESFNLYMYVEKDGI